MGGIQMISDNIQIPKQAAFDMLYLAVCGIKEIVPDESRVASMNLTDIYRLSCFHNLTALVYIALEPLHLDHPIMKKWKEQKEKAVLKNILLDMERKKLFAYMDENKIWHVPLKGVIIKEYYPKPGMRQMSDNDILFDPDYEDFMHEWFVKNQYEVDEYKVSNHNSYHKKPVLNFEMHMALFISGFDVFGHGKTDALMDYYAHIKERLIRLDEDKYEYKFTDEDFYLYFLVHSYKHYINSGIGVKVLLDCYVILKQIEANIDQVLLEQKLKDLGLYEYDQQLRALTTLIFEHYEDLANFALPKDLQHMYDFFISAGTYGTHENFIENQIHKQGIEEANKAKWTYIKKRLIPDHYYFESSDRLKYIYNHKYLMPFFLTYRVFRGVFTKGGQVFKEGMMVMKFKK